MKDMNWQEIAKELKKRRKQEKNEVISQKQKLLVQSIDKLEKELQEKNDQLRKENIELLEEIERLKNKPTIGE